MGMMELDEPQNRAKRESKTQKTWKLFFDPLKGIVEGRFSRPAKANRPTTYNLPQKERL